MLNDSLHCSQYSQANSHIKQQLTAQQRLSNYLYGKPCVRACLVASVVSDSS